MGSLDGLIYEIDGDFSNKVPIHLRGEGVDTDMINRCLEYLNNERIISTLTSRMNLQTQAAFSETVEWYIINDARERAIYWRAQRLNGNEKLEEAKKRVKAAKPERITTTINSVYTRYLLGQGLPFEKITLGKKLLLYIDANIARASGRKVYEVYGAERKIGKSA